MSSSRPTHLPSRWDLTLVGWLAFLVGFSAEFFYLHPGSRHEFYEHSKRYLFAGNSYKYRTALASFNFPPHHCWPYLSELSNQTLA